MTSNNSYLVHDNDDCEYEDYNEMMIKSLHYLSQFPLISLLYSINSSSCFFKVFYSLIEKIIPFLYFYLFIVFVVDFILTYIIVAPITEKE